ncbi:multicomponent Na+:H+ antiporter subunit F [Anaerosolibacter carboniphilus]|uniref:Multicomponent Na+:H+ antiporter subunit F n=1 Tax=Anaerosolibacter carboniphilus TaxID=1417629 RepID=A0A841KL38_9FIRM|nr:monovalent cation/H+ antiporter complex subunit F [Anaerosolibacter carboniphilus]MBB6213941.1 multicomponent Na+:H+ antiporter subunit F [Anaerosolibacter carboniphilus]
MNNIFVISLIILTLTIILCTMRAIIGPTAADRLIAVNVIGTKTIVLIALVSLILKETYFVDVALVYALISFLTSIVIAEFIEDGSGGHK